MATADSVSAIIQSKWNDSCGIPKASITFVVTRPDIEAWMKDISEMYLVACYPQPAARETRVAQDTWQIDETITVDILLKCTPGTFASQLSSRTVMQNMVKTIIHSYQAGISGVALAWTTRDISIEQPFLLRYVIWVNCMYYHHKT
jgi:hypothetical protein